MTGEGSRLRADALHQAAVAGDRVHVVVEKLIAWSVEGRCLPEAGQRHANTRRDACTQRAGGALDACSPAVFRMSRGLGVQLAELLQVFQRDGQLAEDFILRIDRFHAGQVQHRVEQR